MVGILVLIGGPALGGWGAGASIASASATAPDPTNQLGPGALPAPQGQLSANTSTVPEGISVSFLLAVTDTNCYGIRPNLTVVFHLGDGFTFPEHGADLVANCTVPGLTQVTLVYAYHVVGPVQAWASASWTNGSPIRSENLSLTIGPPPNGAPTLAVEWAGATWAALGGGLAAVYLLRRFARRPPALPISQV